MEQILNALEGANQETLSISVASKILKYISSEGDKKRLRQVCRNWRVVVDQVAGLKLKLDNQNLDFVFESNLVKTCPSHLVIEKSAGLIPWNFCSSSENQLQIVEILGEFLVDNWKPLLTICKGIHTLRIQLQEKPKYRNNIISAWNSWSEAPQFEVRLNELSKFFIKGIMTHWDFHYSIIVHLLKTIETPKLKQFVCSFWVDDLCYQQPIFPEFSEFQKSIMELKQNCSELKSFGWVSALSVYGKNEYWQSLCKRGKNALIIHGSYSFWKPIANLFLAGNTLEEIHYDFGTVTDSRNAGQILQDTAAIRSQNIEKLSLGAKTFMTRNIFEIRPELFRNLREIKIGWIFGLEREIPPNFLRIRMCWGELPANLEKVSISYFSVPFNMLQSILDCPKMKEISIRNQNEKYKKFWFGLPISIRKVLNHETLKWIILDSSSSVQWLKLFFSCSIGDLFGKWTYGYEKDSGFKQRFYYLNTSLTRENLLESRSIKGESDYITDFDFRKPKIPHGFAIVIAQNVTDAELQNMKLRYNVKSSFGYQILYTRETILLFVGILLLMLAMLCLQV